MYTALKTAVLAEKIDWIAYSQGLNLEWGFPDYIDNHWKTIKPTKYYNHAEENKQGVKRQWNTENVKQGRSVTLAGVASGTLQGNQLDFLQWVNTSERKATRIDFAIDITHSKFTPKMVREHLLRGEAVTHAQSAPRYDDTLKGGFTQYVGKKSSETYTRIYDKAVEQKVGFQWTRVETVYQGERAAPALSAFLSCGSTRPLIKRHIDFPNWRDWQAIMSDNVAQFTTPTHETATRAWLLSQVATALAKELHRDDDHSFWFEFQNRVGEELYRIEGKDAKIVL